MRLVRDLWLYDVIADSKGKHCVEYENEIIGHHASPIDADIHFQSFVEKEIGLPENGNEEDTNDLA